jgi:hypothetical protein
MLVRFKLWPLYPDRIAVGAHHRGHPLSCLDAVVMKRIFPASAGDRAVCRGLSRCRLQGTKPLSSAVDWTSVVCRGLNRCSLQGTEPLLSAGDWTADVCRELNRCRLQGTTAVVCRDWTAIVHAAFVTELLCVALIISWTHYVNVLHLFILGVWRNNMQPLRRSTMLSFGPEQEVIYPRPLRHISSRFPNRILRPVH